jgi:hypothetical protein
MGKATRRIYEELGHFKLEEAVVETGRHFSWSPTYIFCCAENCSYEVNSFWDRCYDHNFLRFLTIFGEKIGVFLENQCYDQFFFKI